MNHPNDTQQVEVHTANTLGTVVLQVANTTLTGYIMSDGTFQFIIGSCMNSYPTLLDVWQDWLDHSY